MRARNAFSYAFLTLGVVALFAAAIVPLLAKPLASAGLALAFVFFGCGWLVMAPESGVESGRPMRIFLGRLILSAGLLIAFLCGACTLYTWTLAIPAALHPDPGARHYWPNFSSLPNAIGIPLIFGGIPFAIGIGILLLGRWLIRSYKRKTEGSGA